MLKALAPRPSETCSPGVLLGATAVPVWSSHHRLLPFHFGIVALGSASAVLELLGFRMAAPTTTVSSTIGSGTVTRSSSTRIRTTMAGTSPAT